MKAESLINNNGLNALETLEKFLNKIGWDPQKTEDEETFWVDFVDDNTPIRDAYFIIRVEFERFLSYFNFKDQVNTEYRMEVIEFITRANYSLVIGNFEFDYQESSIRFKSSIDFTGIPLSDNLIRNTIKSAMDTVEQYADVLVDVIYGTKTAIEAIKIAEDQINYKQ